ncbi:MAG: hotdog fold thioesterase [Bacteroidetes bacterium]|nr:MAG: hotdog fold thioesterase [Bacteroidota bacterium]
MKTPEQIVSLMLEKDAFSEWLGVELKEIALGKSRLKATVHEQMLNGFRLAHGGISYSLSDSALAFASNSRGNKCVSIETSISHVRPVLEGDELDIVCEEKYRGKKIGVYEVEIRNQTGKIVSLFKGTVHISEELW